MSTFQRYFQEFFPCAINALPSEAQSIAFHATGLRICEAVGGGAMCSK